MLLAPPSEVIKRWLSTSTV